MGYWASLLRERGVDVLALDVDPPKDGQVVFGDAARITSASPSGCEGLLRGTYYSSTRPSKTHPMTYW